MCAFKPQIAYFAAHGAEDQLERLMQHMRANAPQVPVILDAKRGDIGSTAEQYAILRALRCRCRHAVALHGLHSIEAYLAYHGKGRVFCSAARPTLAATICRPSAWPGVEGQPLMYEHVARLAQGPWNKNSQLGLVVGATYPAGDRARAHRAHAAAADPRCGRPGR